MAKTKEVLAATAAVVGLAACAPSAGEIARQHELRAAFDAANPVTLDVGGSFQVLPIRDLGSNTPPAYTDQFCIAKPVLNCNLHNFVYADGTATALSMNDNLGGDDCKTIYTREANSLESGAPGSVKALVAVAGGRPTPELAARVLPNGSIEVCDVAAQRTPEKDNSFSGSPVVVFVKDPVTKSVSLRSPDRPVTHGRAPATLAAGRNPQPSARRGAVI